MKSRTQYINEHFVNALTKEDMKKHIDAVWDILTKAYEKIGGMDDDQIVELFNSLMKEADEHDMRMEKNDDNHGDSLRKCIIW